MRFVKTHIIFLLLFLSTGIKAQNLFHQDIFYGGVTAGGVSTGIGAMSPGDTVSLPLYIEPGSSIRKAYLFTYEVGFPPSSQTIYVNGNGFVFDSTSNKIMTSTHTNPNFTPIKLYYKDITTNINSSITDTFNIYFPYTPLNNPPPNSLGWGWWTAFLYIEYENSSLPKVASTIWINDKDFTGSESYTMSGMNSINNSSPVGLSIFSDRACSITDATDVFLNSNYLGAIGGSDSVNWQWNCAGAKGHFYYQNSSLSALDDDTANSTMHVTDALADVSSYLSSGATGYTLDLIHNNNINAGKPNVNLLFFNTYTTPCDTFSTSLSADTAICNGDSIQLFATGGSNYYWQPATGLGNPNIANPMASPDSTMLYIVRIENTPGCSRTEKVLVSVNEPPKISDITIKESVCGNDDGQITVTASGANPLQYSIGSGFQSSNSFSNLVTGSYIITVLDNNGCTSDTTVFIPETNPVSAQFTANPQSGAEPLFVDLDNQSTGANNYAWFIDSSFLSNNFNESYIFDSSGVYTIELIAWNNSPQCADTFSLEIIVYDSLIVQIPNVFTPNNDGSNDIFSLKVDGAKEIKGVIFNRWGNTIHEYSSEIPTSPAVIDFWDGYTQTGKLVSDGVYFYVIELYNMKNEIKTFNGTINVFK